MNLIELIIYGLATWRISSLFVRESGPFQVFLKLRELAGIQHDPDGFPYQYPDTTLAGILSCVWCASIWIGFFWIIFWTLKPEISFIFALPFSISTIAIFTDKKIT